MKVKKKIIIPIAAVAVIGIAAVAVPRIVSGAGSKVVMVSAAPLSKMDLENTVNVTGTVKSEEVTNVYSTLSYQVKEVNVEVGDAVKEGDVLCVLDTESLQAAIDRQSAALANNQAKAQHSLSVAQNNLETEKYNQDNSYDAQLLSADKSVAQAEQALEARQSALENAKIALTMAEQAQKSNTKALRDYKESYGTPKYNEYEAGYEPLYQAVVQGELKITQAENSVIDAEKAVEDAKKDVSDAKAARNAVKAQKHDSLVAGQQQVQSAQLNANLSDAVMQLNELKKDLDNAIIKAPSSGIITAVMATEGGNGTGLLFIIENTQKLKITTKIEEYDVPSVKVGQKARIKSDGTGENEYEGEVTKIAPTALKAANGETVETTDVQFATDVGIINAGELKIGMNARIDIITEQKPDVFAVSYDAVIEDENGESKVFIARPQTIADAENGAGDMPPVSMSAEEYSRLQSEGEGGQRQIDARREAGQAKIASDGGGGMIVVSVPVETGMETDFYIEIMSDSLKEGDLIVSNPAGLADGQEVAIEGAAPGSGGAGAAAGRAGPGRGMAVRMG